MRAMILPRIVSLRETDSPLELIDLPLPEPGEKHVRVQVSACGVCHTELDEIEGRTAPPTLPIVLGHQVVGLVDQLGPGVTKWKQGARVGVGWIYSSDGSPHENISPAFRATGRDANGGYAQYMTVHENYAYAIPTQFSDFEAAPLLCAGAIGYRALRLTQLTDGQLLGMIGFGGSAHLVLQLIRYRYPNAKAYVFARDPVEREFAKQLGAVWAGDLTDRSPEQLHAIIDTTPVWKSLVEGLINLRPGGRLVINAIRKEDADKDYLLRLSYHNHLWMEREIKSVANVTGADIRELLELAPHARIRPKVTIYGLEEANRALMDLKRGSLKGAKVLRVS